MRVEYHFAKIAEATPLEGRRVWIRYLNGLSGEIDLWPFISWGPVYENLRTDDNLFRQVQISDDTICWPDESDIAPENIWEAVLAAQTRDSEHAARTKSVAA